MINPTLDIRLRLIHGVLQRLAERAGADLLHVKGPAVAPALLDPRTVTDPETGAERIERLPRVSNDADVLVRPEHVERFLAEVRRHGWVQKTSFDTSSAFGHASNIYHPKLGNADIHRRFPGLGIDAFDQLWARRTSTLLGNVDCAVPDLTGQRLILLLHAARSGPHHPDADRAWHRASQEDCDEVLALARQVGAELGIAAAIGTLEDFRNHPDYALWKHFRDANPSRINEWRARWQSATTISSKLAVIRNLLFLDPALLEAELGHPPTNREYIGRMARRCSTMVREVWGDLRK